MKAEDAKRLDALAEEAGVGTGEFLATLVRAFGEQARDLAAANRARREEMEREAYQPGPRQEGRAA